MAQQPPQMKDVHQMMADYQSFFLKCFEPQHHLPVWVPLGSIKSVVGREVWLREPIPIGLNATVQMLWVWLDPVQRQAGLNVEALQTAPPGSPPGSIP